MSHLKKAIACCLCLLLVPCFAFAQGDAYSMLQSRIPKDENPAAAVQKIFEDTVLPSLKMDSVGMLEKGITVDMLSKATFSLPIPVFSVKSKPEPSVDGLLQSYAHNDYYTFIVLLEDKPVLLLDIVNRGDGYQFASYTGQKEAEVVDRAAFPTGDRTGATPIYLAHTTGEYFLHKDGSLTSTVPLRDSNAKAATTLEELSQIVQERWTYAEQHPGEIGGGAPASPAASAQTPRPSIVLPVTLGAAAIAVIAAAGVFLGIRSRRAHRGS